MMAGDAEGERWWWRAEVEAAANDGEREERRRTKLYQTNPLIIFG